MKRILTLLVLLLSINAIAQNVGIGNSNPAVKLDVDGALAVRPASTATSITANNQAVTVGNRSYIQITSDNANATNRTFTLSNGLQTGQILHLESNMAGSNKARLASSSNVEINNYFLVFEGNVVFKFLWNGTKWVKIDTKAITKKKVVFSYTGSDQSWTVPDGAHYIEVKLWGAGGGGTPDVTQSNGGGAGFVSGTLAVIPGNALTIIVGEGGKTNTGGSITYGGGGAGENGNTPSGGGRSAIQIINGTDAVTAGGGGGAGDGDNSTTASYGGYGGLTGGTAGVNANRTAAEGGTITTGGTAGSDGGNDSGTNGTQYQGGNGNSSNWEGGGGGGGYFGGGGGGGDWAGGGGGGGSSYIANLESPSDENGTQGSTTAATSSASGGAGDTDYVGGVGVGGASNEDGGNGLVIIYYY